MEEKEYKKESVILPFIISFFFQFNLFIRFYYSLSLSLSLSTQDMVSHFRLSLLPYHVVTIEPKGMRWKQFFILFKIYLISLKYNWILLWNLTFHFFRILSDEESPQKIESQWPMHVRRPESQLSSSNLKDVSFPFQYFLFISLNFRCFVVTLVHLNVLLMHAFIISQFFSELYSHNSDLFISYAVSNVPLWIPLFSRPTRWEWGLWERKKWKERF